MITLGLATYNQASEDRDIERNKELPTPEVDNSAILPRNECVDRRASYRPTNP